MIEVQARNPKPVEPGYVLHVVDLRSGNDAREFRVLAPDDALPLSSDWLVPPALVYGMRRGEPVRIRGGVSSMLLGSMDRIQAMMVENQDPRRPLQPVELEADRVVEVDPSPDAGTACAFSNGLDAFYSALRNADGIDALLYMHGFEATPADQATLFRLLPQVKASARDMGKRLLLVDSDHWELIWRDGGRTEDSGIAMLVMAGLLMSSRVKRLLFGASYPQQREDEDWASGSAFAKLWRTEYFETVQDGAVSRSDKMRLVGTSDVAMKRLRVCWKTWGRAYNCGTCWKCVRTLVNMELADMTGRCETLPRTLDLDAARKVVPHERGRATLLKDNLREAEVQGKEELAEAIREGVQNWPPRAPRGPKWIRRTLRYLRERPLRQERRRVEQELDAHRRATGGKHLFVSLGAAD